MARRRASDTAPEVTEDEELEPIRQFYRRTLTRPATPPWEGTDWEPVVIGPTWTRDGKGWLIPERTIGWDVLAWCGRWLQVSRDEPWVFTDEQARFILHWYAVDENGRFLYRDGVLQRLKGWGKDPLGACLCLTELCGPARVADMVNGQPISMQTPEPWIQTAAVSLEQTKNTMRLLPGMIPDETIRRYQISLGKEQVYALGSKALFQAVTSSPSTLEGVRATFTLPNETQHWNASNSGHEMAAVIERNSTKSKDGAARTLRITNAYEPGEDSVAEKDRDAWEDVQTGKAVDTGLLYDSLEAPPEAPLTLEAAPAVVEAIRGDSVWLNVPRIVASIADTRNPPSRSRRFWYNQITAAEDAWIIPADFDRLGMKDEVVQPGTEIAMFFDGSKSDDASGLVGCRLSDGFVFVIGLWQRPAMTREWVVDRADVDLAVQNAFELYSVRGFYADPSEARDDVGERYWEAIIDSWHRRFKDRLDVWAFKTGDRQHATAWDMRTPKNQQLFTEAAERFVSDVEEGSFHHDGSAGLKQHVKNARRRPNKYGVSLGKEHRESARKIDLAVCAVGARMVQRLLVNKEEAKRSGRVW